MAAWPQYNFWHDGFYQLYRQYVADNAPKYEGIKDVDCADLSITLLIEFAAKNFLPVTFVDASDFIYCSKARFAWSSRGKIRSILWFNKSSFTMIVRKYIQVKSLYKYNTVENPGGPQPGDLLMRYTTYPIVGITDEHHTALIFATYGASKWDTRFNDPKTFPDYPGDVEAMKEFNTTRYYRGTTNRGRVWEPEEEDNPYTHQPITLWHDHEDDVAGAREADSDVHFDYLNSRGNKKRNAELIFYANARQFSARFEFRKYAPVVVYNWPEWKDLDGPPPLRRGGSIAQPSWILPH